MFLTSPALLWHKSKRIVVKLVSAAQTGFFYVTEKSATKRDTRLALRKHDPIVNEHVMFYEQKGLSSSQSQKLMRKRSVRNMRFSGRRIEQLVKQVEQKDSKRLGILEYWNTMFDHWLSWLSGPHVHLGHDWTSFPDDDVEGATAATNSHHGPSCTGPYEYEFRVVTAPSSLDGDGHLIGGRASGSVPFLRIYGSSGESNDIPLMYDMKPGQAYQFAAMSARNVGEVKGVAIADPYGKGDFHPSDIFVKKPNGCGAVTQFKDPEWLSFKALSGMSSSIRLAVCQILVQSSKQQSLAHAQTFLRSAKERGSHIAVLGEMFACPYSHASFKSQAEEVPPVGGVPDQISHPVTFELSRIARELSMWIIGGSVPELVPHQGGDKIFNTSVVFNNSGAIVGKYRKLHLFDMSLPGMEFRESSTLSFGDLGPCVVPTPWGFDIGLGICFDLRFPEYSAVLRKISENMKMIVFPAAFNTVTGPLHWQLLGRARAVDVQSFCVLASTARPKLSEGDSKSSYCVYGHSMVVAPNGSVLGELGPEEGILVQDIDVRDVDLFRSQIPLRQQCRSDVY